MADEPTTPVEKQAATLEAGAKKLRAQARRARNPESPPLSSTAKATAVGASTGSAGAVVITWVSSEIERRYAVPQVVTAALLGSAYVFVARWAAKLLPD